MPEDAQVKAASREYRKNSKGKTDCFSFDSSGRLVQQTDVVSGKQSDSFQAGVSAEEIAELTKVQKGVY